jgi:hypothetical protein
MRCILADERRRSRNACARPSLANAATVKARREWRDGKRRGGACLLLCAYARFAIPWVSLPPSHEASADRSLNPGYENKGSGTPTDAVVLVPCCWHGRASSRRRSAERARLSAFHHGSGPGEISSQGPCSRPRFLGLGIGADAVTIPIPGAEPTRFLRALPAFTCPSPASTSRPSR